MLEHLLGHGEVGNYAVFHGTNGFNIAWNAPEHLLCLATNRLYDFFASGAAVMTNCHHRRLVEHNALTPNINQRVGCPEVDRHIGGKITTKESEHECLAKKY